LKKFSNPHVNLNGPKDKAMFKNYFRIAARVLVRNKVYVALNVAGLGFALACCLLAYLNYDYHARFDANFPHTENVYRINSMRTVDGAVQEWAVTPSALGFALKNQSGIRNVAQLACQSLCS
jgi:putative ABC transport system permease protein